MLIVNGFWGIMDSPNCLVMVLKIMCPQLFVKMSMRMIFITWFELSLESSIA